MPVLGGGGHHCQTQPIGAGAQHHPFLTPCSPSPSLQLRAKTFTYPQIFRSLLPWLGYTSSTGVLLQCRNMLLTSPECLLSTHESKPLRKPLPYGGGGKGAPGSTVNWGRVSKGIDPSETTCAQGPCKDTLAARTQGSQLYTAIAVPLSYQEWNKEGNWLKHLLQKELMAHETCLVGFGLGFF